MLAMVIVLPQANIRLIKAGLKIVGAMCSCGSDVASVLIVSCSLFFVLQALQQKLDTATFVLSVLDFSLNTEDAACDPVLVSSLQCGFVSGAKTNNSSCTALQAAIILVAMASEKIFGS